MGMPQQCRKRRSAVATAAVVSALIALVPASASADRPRGKFYCWDGGVYYGYLKLKAGGKYSFNDEQRGTYVYKRAQRRIKFTGYFRAFYGVHKHDPDDGNAVVYLRVKGSTAGYRCG